MADLIDKQAEISRLTKEVNKLDAEMHKSKVKLDNPNYVAKAPTAVVEQEKIRAAELAIAITKLRERLSLIEHVEDRAEEPSQH